MERCTRAQAEFQVSKILNPVFLRPPPSFPVVNKPPQPLCQVEVQIFAWRSIQCQCLLMAQSFKLCSCWSWPLLCRLRSTGLLRPSRHWFLGLRQNSTKGAQHPTSCGTCMVCSVCTACRACICQTLSGYKRHPVGQLALNALMCDMPQRPDSWVAKLHRPAKKGTVLRRGSRQIASEDSVVCLIATWLQSGRNTI